MLTVRYEMYLEMQYRLNSVLKALSWVRRSPRKPRFDPGQVHVRLGQVRLRASRISPRSVIPPVLHSYLHLLAARMTRSTQAKPGGVQKAILFRKSDKVG